MATLPPPATKAFPEDSLEREIYNVVEKYRDNIPITNDRNRLGFNLYKYKTGEGDSPLVCIQSAKLKLSGITEAELAEKIDNDLRDIN